MRERGREGETERERERETDRETDRQSNKQTKLGSDRISTSCQPHRSPRTETEKWTKNRDR